MARFIDGPAAGVSLSLRRAPKMLRAVRSPKGEWDALDQLDDEPNANETIVVYRMVGERRMFHVCRSPRSQSGWHQEADYAVLPEQPADANVRTAVAWRNWNMRLAFKEAEAHG